MNAPHSAAPPGTVPSPNHPPARSRRFLPHPGFVAAAFLLAAATAQSASLSDHARTFRRQLAEQILPYWHDTAQDNLRGGYLLADDLQGRGHATQKQLVSQSRMVWGFAHAHRKGYTTTARDYLTAARKGHLFLRVHFLDPANGGYYWKTDLEGKPINDCKFLYGESFVVYALVELHRASGEREPLNQALELYRTIQKHTYDSKHGGWIEHTERNWKPLPADDPRNEVEVVGLKSANAHLHWMEALAELYEASRDPDVGRSLAEALQINQQHFYPLEAGRSCFHRQPDWAAATGPRSAGLSYGHNVEFAWLMVRAEQVLGRAPSWKHFYAHLDHALKFGCDLDRGGLYNRGENDRPATDTSKVWWVAAEWIAALSDSLVHQPNPAHLDALDRQIQFVLRHQIDPKDALWLDTVTADGQPKSTAKAHNWKANYHDVRAIVKFIEAFGSGTQ